MLSSSVASRTATFIACNSRATSSLGVFLAVQSFVFRVSSSALRPFKTTGRERGRLLSYNVDKKDDTFITPFYRQLLQFVQTVEQFAMFMAMSQSVSFVIFRTILTFSFFL
ncbi:unnamed protein product [Wuchereria bancrofti]|uniref:Uncharacterized protein n=1 Tax=Wuchereria bancrofti TaxID=6293 RepID=A0A3P7E5T9_WUCBA|nr:unnamed protein product [Wuchereria bancrofti]